MRQSSRIKGEAECIILKCNVQILPGKDRLNAVCVSLVCVCVCVAADRIMYFRSPVVFLTGCSSQRGAG